MLYADVCQCRPGEHTFLNMNCLNWPFQYYSEQKLPEQDLKGQELPEPNLGEHDYAENGKVNNASSTIWLG